MAFARHATGPTADLRALLSQVHPVFMLPPVAASLFGAVTAVGAAWDLSVAAGHVIAVFLAVYTAHLKDGYVDFYVRGEDDDHPLTRRGIWIAIGGAALGFGGCLLLLGIWGGLGAVAITAPLWAIGFLHAPQFDTHPVTTTLGYPLGIALAILGGHYVQAGTLSVGVVGFATVFLLVLTGVKIIDDEQDYAYDRSIEKRTVSVVLGRRPARRLAMGLFGAGLGLLLVGGIVGPFPPAVPVAAVVFGLVAALALRRPPTVATMLLVRGAYLFLAVLVAVVWLRPLS